MRPIHLFVTLAFGAVCGVAGYVAGSAASVDPPGDARGNAPDDARDRSRPAGRPEAADAEPDATGATARPSGRASSTAKPAGRARRPQEPEPIPDAVLLDGPDRWTVEARLSRPFSEEQVHGGLRAALGVEVDAKAVSDAEALSRSLRMAALNAANGADWKAISAVAENVRRERELLADSARGGTIEMLRALGRTQIVQPVTPQTHKLFHVVGDAATFADHFRRRTPEVVIPVPAPDTPDRPWIPPQPLAAGTTLRYPEGVHTLVARSLLTSQGAQRAIPADVTIEGAGMDRTLVRIDSEIESSRAVVNLTFRDLTIDCGDNYLTDLGGDNPAMIRMERCRVVGFDMGAGGSVMFSASTGAFYATDCRFDAGYGRTDPGCGNLFRVGRGLLVRCERSAFVGPFSSVLDTSPGATMVFADCRFERSALRDPVVIDEPPYGIRFENCTVANPVGKDEKPKKRPLSDFNPAWPSKMR